MFPLPAVYTEKFGFSKHKRGKGIDCLHIAAVVTRATNLHYTMPHPALWLTFEKVEPKRHMKRDKTE